MSAPASGNSRTGGLAVELLPKGKLLPAGVRALGVSQAFPTFAAFSLPSLANVCGAFLAASVGIILVVVSMNSSVPSFTSL